MNKKTLGLQVATTLATFALVTTSAFAAPTITLTAKQDHGDSAIEKRIQSLTDLETRVSDMKHVSDSDKTSLTTSIKVQLDAMNTLKTKIDSDTDKTTLKNDAKSITENYRIFALVEPKTRITAAADKALELGTSFTTLAGKLQAKITAASTAGNNVTSINANLVDMNAKVADATTQANAAIALVVNLAPDNGNAAVAASNKTTLMNARADLKKANDDLKAARVDAKSIVQALKGFNIATNDSIKNQ